jgi:putative N6-adenine-specific DNA methylase
MYLYQKTNRYFAQIAPGLEDLGAEELTEKAAGEVRTAYGGVYFRAEKAALYRINYTCRIITRVLAPLSQFRCPDDGALYENAKRIRWSDFFGVENTFAVFSTVSNSKINHSQFASLRLKDAVADCFREKEGKRPNVDPLVPDVWINLHIENDVATVSLDTSGGSLHRRGYRKETVEAPMQETIAAAVIRMTGWDGSTPLYDPLAGSGTLLCEALMHFSRIPSGFLRKRFGFAFLPDFAPDIWESEKEKADRQIRALPERLIGGSDVSDQAVAAMRSNLARLPGGESVGCALRDFKEIPELENRTIVTNPPYGIRLEAGADLDPFYRGLGDFLKQRCRGSNAYIYFGNRRWIKSLGLKPSWKKPIPMGGLDGRLVKYALY